MTLAQPMAPPLALSCRGLKKSLGGKPIVQALDLDVAKGQVLALLGGSGSGKTTLLRLIAGLADPDAGEITIAGERVFGGGRTIGPEHRAVDMVFQDYALWPHLTVKRNLSFGLEARRLPKAEIKERVAHALRATRLEALEDRLPSMLSGGQQQRVAIARCLAARPQLILFDEPLSNLDAALRDEVRIEMLELVRAEGLTAIYVTHDQTEALAVADLLAVMREGRIEQIDAPQRLYDHPSSAFVARFLGGFSLIPGTVEAGSFKLADGSAMVPIDAGATATQAFLIVRPEDVRPAGPTHNLNALSGPVLSRSYLGRCWRLEALIAGERVRLDWPTPVETGATVSFVLAPGRAGVVPGDGSMISSSAVANPA